VLGVFFYPHTCRLSLKNWELGIFEKYFYGVKSEIPRSVEGVKMTSQ